MERLLRPSRFGFLLLAAACGLTACKGRRSRGGSNAAQWVDSPSGASASGTTLTFSQLGVQFETPDTLYVYKDCGEASHAPDSTTKWVPVVTCSSGAAGDFEFGDADEEEDPFAEAESEQASGAEDIDLTVFVTKKTRPIDERSVTWFENKYKQAGLVVDEIAFQANYQKKMGIYTKLYVTDPGTNSPSREIVQFMFPRDDVVFIARMEYPFGETRSVMKDWEYILWNFDWIQATSETEE